MKSSRKYLIGGCARRRAWPLRNWRSGSSTSRAAVGIGVGVLSQRRDAGGDGASRASHPRETVAELTKQIAAAPSRADLVSLRAHEAELNLDFTTAEQDWKTYARAGGRQGGRRRSRWRTTITGGCNPRRNWRHCWRRQRSPRRAAMR